MVFNVYFARRVVPPEGVRVWGVTVAGPALWSFLVSGSMLAMFVLAPLLGAIADLAGRKRAFLRFFWLLGCAGSLGLWTATPGAVWTTAILFAVANIGFAGGNVFYNAFLPGLGSRQDLGRISGFGWAVGYLGGGLCLALNLLMIQRPGLFGLPPGDAPIRAALLSVGVWWLLFGAPIFLATPPDRGGAARPFVEWVRLGWARLADTFRHVRSRKNLFLFVLAYALYNDGIETVILTASVVGAELLGLSTGELIRCFLMIQGVAFAGALLFGYLADRWGHKTVILLTLGVFAAVVVAGSRMTSAATFWALGAVLGLVLGGSQAASRSLMGRLTPPDRTGEFFGFFGVIGKLTAVVGPFVFGLATQAAGLRRGMLALLVFFAAGGAVLSRVRDDEPRPPAP